MKIQHGDTLTTEDIESFITLPQKHETHTQKSSLSSMLWKTVNGMNQGIACWGEVQWGLCTTMVAVKALLEP